VAVWSRKTAVGTPAATASAASESAIFFTSEPPF
jgi:hypothetical protein